MGVLIQPTQGVLHRFLIGGDDVTNCLSYGLERSVWQQSKESRPAGLQSSLEATEITDASSEKVQLDQWQWDAEESLPGGLGRYNPQDL